VTKREETSIWKKEITFRRKPKAIEEAATPAKAVEPSIWKKEIALRRKPKATEEAVASPKAGEPSIWKKEIAVRRKPKATGETAASPKTGEPSIWKKEITFRRKQKAEPGLGAPVAPEQSAGPGTQPEVLLPPVALPVSPLVQAPGVPPVTASPAPPVMPVTFSSAAPPPFADSSPEAEQAEAAMEVPEHFRVAGGMPDQAVPSPVTPPVEPPVDAAVTPPVMPLVVSAATSQPLAVEVGPEEEEHANVESSALVREAELEPVPAAPVAEATPEPVPTVSRRERRHARQAADRLAKDQRKRAKEIAKDERKALPSTRARVVGLKVGASQIAAAEVINKGAPRIVRMARTPLPRGVVVGGELREPEELAAALKTFFRKNNLSKTCVRLGVANNRIGVRTFDIAGIDDEKQLANAIRFRAQETLPIPLDEAVLDYRILDDRLDEEGVRVRRVLLVVAHRELVERYVAACRKAGLKLIGIDLEAFALLRALADPGAPPEDAALVCVTIGHDRSTLAVSDGRICGFTRVLAWGGSALDVALARLLDITPSGAEPIRRALSLGEEGEAAGLDADHAAEARRTIVAELQVFAREIVASLRFYQEQPNSLGISEILVTGGMTASVGLAAELERLIGLPVRVADPFARIKVPRKLRHGRNGSAGSLAVAVGLGIED
jgi:type IV pilus assembly protein PilM